MRRIFSLFIVAGCLSSPSLADPYVTEDMQGTVDKIIANAYEYNEGYTIVEALTTKIGARLAGTPAEQRARDWAVRMLTAMGFDNVRVEPFMVRLWERNVETAEITAPFPQKFYVTALGNSVSTPKEGIEADIVRFDTLAALKAAPADSLTGKIVFVDQKTTRAQDGAGYAFTVAQRSEAPIEGAKRGAVAALIRSVGTSSHRFPHTGGMTYADGVPKIPVAALSAPDADQLSRALSLEEDVRIKLTVRVRNGGGTQPNWTGPEPEMAPSGNVIAEIRGREKPEEIVLIGAHLDSWDLGTGAVDDGAGVGIVVGAAKVLKATLDRPPRRTIRIVLFGSEEVGLVGAKAYTDAHQAELINHIIAAESDFGAGEIWRFDTYVADEKRSAAGEIGQALSPLGVTPGSNRAFGGPDLRFMRAAGVPVVTLQQNGWDYFDLHHTPDDTLDKIDPDKMTQNVAAYAVFAYLAAEMDQDFRATPAQLSE